VSALIFNHYAVKGKCEKLSVTNYAGDIYGGERK